MRYLPPLPLLENLPLLPPPAPRHLTQQPNIFSSCVNVCFVVEKGAPSTLLQGAQRQQQARETDIYCSAVAALLACQVTTPQGAGQSRGVTKANNTCALQSRAQAGRPAQTPWRTQCSCLVSKLTPCVCENVRGALSRVQTDVCFIFFEQEKATQYCLMIFAL